MADTAAWLVGWRPLPRIGRVNRDSLVPAASPATVPVARRPRRAAAIAAVAGVVLVLALVSPSNADEEPLDGDAAARDAAGHYAPRMERPGHSAPLLGPAAGAAIAPPVAGNLLLSRNVVECSLAVHPRDPDHVLVTAIDSTQGQRIAWYLSRDGLTSVAAQGTFPPLAQSSADPVVSFTRDGSVALLTSLDPQGSGAAIQLRRSRDGGSTWDPVQTLWRGSALHFPDKPWVVVDRRAAGTHAGSVYVTWTGLAQPPFGVHVMSSRDDGASWSTPLQVSTGTADVMPSPVVGPDGELYVCFIEWVSGTLARFHVRVSTDYGQTFGPDIAWTSSPRIRSLNTGLIRATDSLAVAVDASPSAYRGRVYAARMQLSNNDVDAVVEWSDDRGRTWSSPVRIADTSRNDQLLPTLATDANGTLFAAWLDRRDDPANWSYRCYAARSDDGGATWTPSEQLTVLGAPTNENWFGDYNAIVAARGRMFAAWAETGQGAANLLAHARPVDLRGSAAAVSARTGGRVDLAVRAGPAHGGKPYVVALGMSGSAPGTPLGCGVTQNLNLDPLVTTTLSLAGSPVLPHTVGVLGPDGAAHPTPAFAPTPGLLVPLQGLELHVAFVVLDASCIARYASRAWAIRVEP